jgi:chromosome transmission fidelity protein 18
MGLSDGTVSSPNLVTIIEILVANNFRPLDTLVDFSTAATSLSLGAAPVRYAVRQVLDQEYQKNVKLRENAARQARYKAGDRDDDTALKFSDDKENRQNCAVTEDPMSTVKKDFFGRVVKGVLEPLVEANGIAEERKDGKDVKGGIDMKVWVSFHEGFSNAVRKPITVEEILRGL